jgi:hypothetical protein
MPPNNDIMNYYDRSRGWAETNPGWYEVIVQIEDPAETVIRYQESTDWIKNNIHGYHKHSRFMYAGNYLKYKFRYERDYLWFKLIWG